MLWQSSVPKNETSLLATLFRPASEPQYNRCPGLLQSAHSQIFVLLLRGRPSSFLQNPHTRPTFVELPQLLLAQWHVPYDLLARETQQFAKISGYASPSEQHWPTGLPRWVGLCKILS